MVKKTTAIFLVLVIVLSFALMLPVSAVSKQKYTNKTKANHVPYPEGEIITLEWKNPKNSTIVVQSVEDNTQKLCPNYSILSVSDNKAEVWIEGGLVKGNKYTIEGKCTTTNKKKTTTKTVKLYTFVW